MSHVNGAIQYFSFSHWLISISIVSSNVTHVTGCGRIFSLSSLNFIPLYGDITFVHAFIGWGTHVFFCPLATVKELLWEHLVQALLPRLLCTPEVNTPCSRYASIHKLPLIFLHQTPKANSNKIQTGPTNCPFSFFFQFTTISVTLHKHTNNSKLCNKIRIQGI